MNQAQAMIDSRPAVMAVAIAEIDLSGKLVDANTGFLRLLPAGNGERTAGSVVARYFVSPWFVLYILFSSCYLLS